MRCETKRPAGAIGRDCRACARNVCPEPSEVNISSTCKVGQKLGVSPSVDMLHFGVTIPATLPQGSEIPEGLMNNPVFLSSCCFSEHSISGIFMISSSINDYDFIAIVI